MGWDDAIRFKGFVKEQYRKIFKEIALYGKWEESEDPIFHYYGQVYDYYARLIPCSQSFAARGSFPAWAGCDEEGQEFATQYDEKSGLWIFGAAYRSKTYLQQDFIDYIIPYAFERIIHMEAWCELNDEPTDITEECNEAIEWHKEHYPDMSAGYPRWVKKKYHDT